MFCTNGQIPSSLLAFTSFYLRGSIASYASAGIKADLSIRSSVYRSHAGIVSKRMVMQRHDYITDI